jgi:hypothetical protein
MIDTNPISGDQFKQLSGRFPLNGDPTTEENPKPNESDLAAAPESATELPENAAELTGKVNRAMVSQIAALITSMPETAAMTHKFESGQMFSVEG